MNYYHLTTPQQNIWNLQKYYGDTAISNLCGAVFYPEKRDSAKMQQAVYQFIRSQSGIRLRFREEGEPVQYVSEDVGIASDIPVMEFPAMEDFEGYAERFAREPIRLTEGVMYRFVVFQVEDRSGVLVALSHLIADAWTFGLMANRLDVAYAKLVAGEGAFLPQADYTEFIRAEKAYFASERYRKDQAFWTEKYASASNGTDTYEKSPVKLSAALAKSVAAERITRMLPLSLEQKIGAFCKEYPVTEAVLFETAIVVYLAKINRENRTVTIGVPVLNRSNTKEKNIAGMFISTMPLTVGAEEELPVSELARRIARGHMDIFRHQKYPYADILQAMREKHARGKLEGQGGGQIAGNLYDVMVSYQNAKTGIGADTKWYSNGYSEIPLTVHIDNRDGNECHTLNVDYQTAVFGQEEARLLIDRLEYILEQVAEDGEKKIGEICIVPDGEWKKVTEEFNQTRVEYPRDKCVHELFEEQVAKTPEKVALIFEDRMFSYRQLNDMSNSLALFLRERNVIAGDKVAVLLKRDEKVIIAQLAVLKLGAIFIPIDNRYPKDRIEYILSECDAKIIVRNRDNHMSFPIECLIEEWNPLYEKFDLSEFNSIHVSPTDTCYIIFTSGSTGTPKGCMLTNQGIVNFCKNLNCIGKCDQLAKPVCVSVNAISFDMFIAESLFPLVNGYTVALANELESINQKLFSALVIKTYANIIQTTPTKYRLYFSGKGDLVYAKQFRVIVASGEELSSDLLKCFLDNTDATIFNPLGPSECTVYVVGGELHIEGKVVTNGNITIGCPFANNQIYILDKESNPVPIGVAGELCAAGDNVGHGYLNRPELTAERFVPNPFATEENGHGKTMYRTGDLARWRTDGEIEYLGRIDTQVKIRGLRIELGEIESVMAGFPGVQLAAVADKKDETGRQYLVGYYTSESELNEKELRRRLSAKLPKYMVPNYFVRLEAMPMTPSGKTDRRHLPVPDVAGKEEYAAPKTDTEAGLAEIWEKLLKLQRVGRTDDFFELGGDSLLAIALLNEIADVFSVEVSVKAVMENSVLERLAFCIEQSAPKVDRIEQCHMDKYALLPQQKAIYAACRKNPQSLIYNMPAKIPLPEGIDRDRLKKAVCQVMDTIRILKSCIAMEADEVYGIYDQTAQVEFEEVPEEDFVRPFDLGKAPLFRVGFTQHALLFDIHHIIADGETVNLILKCTVMAYEGRPLPEQGLWYGDYVEHYRKHDFAGHKKFFQEMLCSDFEKAELPRTKEGKNGGESRFYRIPVETVSRARAFAERNQLTDTMVFLGAYGILLSGYTGKKDVLSSIIMQNRVHSDTRNMAGMFVNTLPVRFETEGGIKDYFSRVREMVLRLFDYQELPFWEIADAVGMHDKTMVNTSFVYQADGEKSLVLDGKRLSPQFLDTGTAKFDFSMELMPSDSANALPDGKDSSNANGAVQGQSCRMRLEYDRGKYDRALMDELAAAYIRILEQLGKESIADISVLSEEMYHKITEEFNDTAADYSRDRCVHELFVEQVKKTPTGIALVFQEKRFSWRELDEMSNSLAHFLKQKGVGRGDVVPVIARRSWHIVVAMLGILKAGAAYMPVSPGYPEDRIAYMLKTAGSRVALSYGYDGNPDAECVRLDTFDYRSNIAPVGNRNAPEDLCYVVFTSGSTGTPKGVSICHRNVVNYCNNNNNNVCHRIVKGGYRSIVSVTNIVFDIFVTETLLPLLNGITVYFGDDEEVMRQDRLGELISRNRIDILQTTPTRMRSFMLDKGKCGYLRILKAIILGGEAFPADLYRELKKYSGARIYNIYGPAETTVWSANAEIVADMGEETAAADITIGKPIANTQIYIVDGNCKILPIGVPGELCIAGDGVGLGYLNRPELTAKRFVPNPFATEENGHGKTMYRTGDLARWRPDGEIEYLGRIDTQVKIRGLRIELGEIESVMAGFPGIALCAAADKRDAGGRQYLVGYYTAETEPDKKELRQYLLGKLPKYMVPNYFMRLEEMPMTPSGKTDRKNLPVPGFVPREEEYVAPVTSREKTLCRLAAELLGLEKIGVTDDFFAFGGDSLTAIAYVAKAHEAGIAFSLQKVFDYPTVRALCGHLDAGEEQPVRYEASAFDRYRELLDANVIRESFVPEEREPGNVLLTGVTGFLGAHILDTLMKEQTGGIGKIYCLVRGQTEADCAERIRRVLRCYFGNLYEKEIGSRILPVAGDIEKEGMGGMPQDVRTVVHAAASVKHFGSYAYFYRVNCEGTRHVVQYAEAIGARLIHISTLSVSGNDMAENFQVYRSESEKQFDETSFFIGQPLDNVYIRSKFEAERAVYDAMLSGLDAKVIRVGNLTNRFSDFTFQPNYRENAFLTRVKALLELGKFPDYLMPLYVEFSPVDQTAEGIVRIARHAGKQCVFHLYNSRHLYYGRFLEIVRRLGIPMEVVDADAFYGALRQTMAHVETAYIYEALQNDLDGNGRLVYDSNIRIKGSFTEWFLKKTGFAWSRPDLEYIRGYVEYFRGIGYLKV